METFSTIGDIANNLLGARTRHVWDYWCAKWSGDRAPGWSTFNLMDLYKDAPICLVLDVLPGSDPIDYRYRYVGTMIVQYRWKLDVPDHTGLTFFEARHQYDFSEVKIIYDRCTTTGLPALMHRNFDAHDATGVHERLVLPLTAPDGKVDKLVVVVERLRETLKSTRTEAQLF
tara:strand:+ start:116 stop:634 length:519 start_codon:yes stop_codon:yes gene_type:complete